MPSRTLKLSKVRVIEPAVYQTIDINKKTMFLDPVQSLDDLLDWETRLERLGIDYAIAEFDFRHKRSDSGDLYGGEGIVNDGRFFSIFINPSDFSEFESEEIEGRPSESEAF